MRMVYKKTSWYSFIAPMMIGATVGGATAEQLSALRKFGALLGIAFQTQDDVLNLVGDEERHGKEIAGDLWEGKHTLIVLHMMRAASERERGVACGSSWTSPGRALASAHPSPRSRSCCTRWRRSAT